MSKNYPTTEQKSIIEFDADMLVTAVPGSGKTKTIIDKVEKLAKIVSNKNIVVITYTYRAADEVSDRLSNRNIENEHVWSGTIHKFCLEYIINPNLNLIPDLCKGYDIVDEDDVDKITRHCAETLGITLRFNDPINLSLDINGSLEEADDTKKKVAIAVYKHLRENKLISFDQILYYAYRVLVSNKYVAKNIAHGAEWIIIDEYQDTKELQYQIISQIALASKNVKLMFVGDPNQAIYTNLGGVVKNKIELDEMMDREFSVKHLTGCFRSAQRIIDFYNVFACEHEDINSNISNYPNPYVKYFAEVAVEPEQFGIFAKRYIDEFYNNGMEYSDICVALPWGLHLIHLSSWFLKNAPNIPIDSPIITPLKKMDDGIWNNLIRPIFVVFNYKNVFYYERMLRVSLKEIEIRFGVRCKDNLDDLLDYYSKISLDDHAIATQIIETEAEKIFSDIIGLSVEIYKPYIDFLLDATKSKIQRYSAQLNDTVECFKQCYKSKNGVVFSTFHGCKGEEYRGVIVGGLNEGYVPHSSRLAFRDESKRLLFVVMSRAKEKLVLSSRPMATVGRGNPYPVNNEVANCKFDFDE